MRTAWRRVARTWLWAGAMLLVGLSLTIYVSLVMGKYEQHEREEQFQRVAVQRLDALQTGLGVALNQVEALGVLLDGTREPGGAEFSRVASALGVGSLAQARAWVSVVPASSQSEFEMRARREGAEGFEITERDALGTVTRARGRAAYYPVRFVQPHRGNERAVGFDLGSDGAMRATLLEAAGTGRLVVSSRLALASDSGGYGFVLCRPVYREIPVPRDVASRSQALSGFVVGMFELPVVVGGSRDGSEALVSMALFDEDAPVGSRLLYPKGDSLASVDDLPPGPRATRSLTVGARTWVAAAHSGGAQPRRAYSAARIALGAGILLTLLFALALRVETGRRQANEETVKERTAALEQAFEDLTGSRHDREETETRYRRLVEMSADAMVSTRGTVVAVANVAALRLLGAAGQGQVVGKSLLDLFDEDPPDLVKALQPVLAGEGHVSSVAGRLRCLDGSRVHVEVAAVSLVEGGVVTVQAVIRDVSERRRVEAAMAEARERAEAGNQAKGQFLANVSHEIRTPLNGVLGMTQLLLRSDLSPEQRRYATMVRSSAESLLGVVNDILDFSKVEAHKVVLEVADFDLHAVLGEVAEAAALKAREKGLEITSYVMPGTPTGLRGDQARLRQVLAILVGNAVKFSQQGEIAVRVRLQSEEREELTLHFSVADSGIGIPQAKVETLFSPFVQADGSHTRRYGGTGLGLAISRHMVELMGGRIGVTSQEGRGSTFWFTAVLSRGTAAGAVAEMPPSFKGRRALVVDAQAGNRALVKKILEKWECACEAAASGEEALGVLRGSAETGNPFDVVLMDSDLPDGNGREVARRVRADVALGGVRLLLMSCFSLGDETDAADAHVFSGFVNKPVSQPLLREVLEGVLDPGEGRARSVGEHVASAGGGRHEWRGKRILVAEDNLTNAEVTRTMLSQFGCEVDTAANGREAVEAAKRADYDMILMDCEMPVLDGYGATRLIREGDGRAAHVPIVAITADALPQDRERCLQSGMSDYLAKPIRLADLGRILGRWLSASPSGSGEPRPELPPQPAVDVFDEQDLLARLMGNRGMAVKLLAGFLQDIPNKISGLRKAIGQQDSPAARMQAHALKGAAATISAPALRQVAGDIEAAAGAGDLEGAAGLLALLDERFEQLEAALKEGALI